MVRTLLTTCLYLVMFFASIFACHYAQRFREDKRWAFFLVSAIAVLIPALFAGLRGQEIGTDVLSYAKPEFVLASQSKSLGSYLASTTTDYGYALLVFFSFKVWSNFHSLLFFTALLQLIPLYIVGLKISKWFHCPSWAVLACYYFLYYIVGFNIMRQEIAAGFILLCFLFLLERKYVKAIIVYLIAQLFHSTAIIGLLFALIGVLLFYIQKRKIKIFMVVAGVLAIFLLMSNWLTIANFVMNLGILPASRMQVYIDAFSGVDVGYKSYMFEVSDSQYLEIFFKVLLLAFPLISLFKKRVDNFLFSTLVVVLISVEINVLFLYFFHSAYGYRITIYAEYFYMLIIPLTLRKDKGLASLHGKDARVGSVSLMTIINVGTVVLNWFVLFMIFGNHETLPLYFSLYQ